jgi:NAD(P)-dependent dehydrogenase (short-subunit alcohol dehydrogenase family)
VLTAALVFVLDLSICSALGCLSEEESVSDSLKDRVAIVTGGSRGLGLAIATAFAAEGARVVVASTGQQGADNAAKTIPGAIGIECDVREEDQVKGLIDATVERFGAVHVMVPNAGILSPYPLLGMDFARWRALMSVNLDAAFLSLHYAAPAIIASGGGSLVMMSSVAGTAGVPLMAHYAAAKSAILSLTKTAALELRDHGVRVNALVPGLVAGTDMGDGLGPECDELLGLPAGSFDAMMAQKQGRFGTAQDVARAAVFLASGQDSSWITGTALHVDGGLTASLL